MTEEKQSQQDLDTLSFYAVDTTKKALELIAVLNAFKSTQPEKVYRLYAHPVRKDIKIMKDWIKIIEDKINSYEQKDKSDQGWY